MIVGLHEEWRKRASPAPGGWRGSSMAGFPINPIREATRDFFLASEHTPLSAGGRRQVFPDMESIGADACKRAQTSTDSRSRPCAIESMRCFSIWAENGFSR